MKLSSQRMFTRNPLTLFWMGILVRNMELLQTLINKKGHQGSNPGGHSFVVLNVSINNTPVFVLEVLTYGNQDGQNRSVF